MKNYTLILSAALLVATSCNVSKTQTGKSKEDSLTTQKVDTIKSLTVKMEIKDTVKAGELLQLKFTVYNNTDSVRRFCKWHTPFEPLMSKYLDITNEKGEEVLYQGAMAKRIMPPPESSYIKLNAKDSVSANVDLLKAYAITKPAKYTISYVGKEISGLEVKQTVSFVYVK